MADLHPHWMAEGGVVVRGTEVADYARTAALRGLMAHWLADLYPEYPAKHPDEWLETALYYARRLRDREPMICRMWRWTPCSPVSCFDGGGHTGHLTEARRLERGSWLGVYWPEV